MDADISNFCLPEFKLLDSVQIKQLHHSVLKILDEVGVRINHPEAVDLLAGHGARVLADDVVQISSSMVEDAMKIQQAGADMIGGCCGTNPEFIKAVTAAIAHN